MSRRVVVTGLGAVTPLGNTVKDTWDGFVNGRNGVGPVTLFDASDLDVRYAATAPAGAEPHSSAESLDVRWWPVDGLPDGHVEELSGLVSAARRAFG